MQYRKSKKRGNDLVGAYLFATRASVRSNRDRACVCLRVLRQMKESR